MTDANKLEKLKKKLPSNLTKELSDENLLYFINAEPDQLELAKNAALTSVSVIMGGNIKMSEEMAAKERFVNEMKSLNVNSGLKEAVNALGSYAITANYFYDPAVTKEKKKAEEDLVPPVYILQGQVIVREGETISSDMYNQLKLVGLLEKGNSFQPYVGLAVLIGVLLYFMHKQFEVFLQRKEDKPYILAYITILSITIVLMKIISLFQKLEYAGIAYVVPVAMGTILVKLMIGDRFVFLTSMIFLCAEVLCLMKE